jgi:hypothetical protein
VDPFGLHPPLYQFKNVMMYLDKYNRKIDEFIIANNFTKLPNDITNKQQIKT